MKHSQFTFERIQIKSIDKARLFAHLFDQMEVEFGIRTGRITLKDVFICPDITDEEIESLCRTPSERVLRDIIKQLK